MATGTSKGTTARQASPEPSPSPIPPLRNGDRLSAPEFERRYHAMPRLKKAELIEGVVYVGSPVSDAHGSSHTSLNTWLGLYWAATPGTIASDNGTVRLDLDNEPQPDVHLRIAQSHGGQSKRSDDGYVEGAPELVAEVALSSVSYDLHDKLRAYRRSGVREYLVWRVEDGELDWLALRDGRYEPLAAGEDSLIRSEVFPGLWLDREALLRGDLAAVVAAAQRGLASPEHAAFVEQLRTVAARLAEGGPRP